MTVHLTFLSNLIVTPALLNGQYIWTQAPVFDLATAVGKDITIGDTAILIPEGTVALTMFETEETPFRYAIGDVNVTVPASPNAHRWHSLMNYLTVGVTGGSYFRTATA